MKGLLFPVVFSDSPFGDCSPCREKVLLALCHVAYTPLLGSVSSLRNSGYKSCLDLAATGRVSGQSLRPRKIGSFALALDAIHQAPCTH